jgi:hypothetical protein
LVKVWDKFWMIISTDSSETFVSLKANSVNVLHLVTSVFNWSSPKVVANQQMSHVPLVTTYALHVLTHLVFMIEMDFGRSRLHYVITNSGRGSTSSKASRPAQRGIQTVILEP